MGVFDGLSSWLFGADPLSDASVKAQEELQAKNSAAYAAREQADYQRQLQYGQMLQAQIAGTAPSVANRQMQASLDQINRNAASQSAGATGSNAALANYGAMLNGAALSSQAAQQGAVLRAQEIQSAQNQLGGLYANMGQRSQVGYGTALGAAQNYSQMATNIAQANQRAQMAATGTLLSTAGVLGAAGLGAPAVPAAAAAAAGGAAAGNAYSQAQPGLAASQTAGPPAYYGYSGPALGPSDQPSDPYQASNTGYSNGLYPYSPSNSVGQR